MKEEKIEIFMSSAWIEIKEIIQRRIAIAKDRLSTAKSWEDVLRLQGQIEALKTLAALSNKEKFDG